MNEYQEKRLTRIAGKAAKELIAFWVAEDIQDRVFAIHAQAEAGQKFQLLFATLNEDALYIEIDGKQHFIPKQVYDLILMISLERDDYKNKIAQGGVKN